MPQPAVSSDTEHSSQPPLKELGLAWLVTIIWASSFVLIKVGLRDIQPLGFAALRYSLGGLILLGYLGVSPAERMPRLGWRTWGLVALTGVLAYTAGQGLFYLGQTRVSALTGSFFYSLSPVFVLFLGAIHLRRRPNRWQMAGLVAVVVGALIFYPPHVAVSQRRGVILLLASNVGTGYYLLLAGRLRSAARLSGGWLTAVALLVGGGLLFVPALLIERQVRLALTTLPLIVWLAIVNTALAYTLWTHVLRVLSAFQVSVMGCLIPLQTGVISWLILGNALSWTQVVGLLIVVAGVIVVQARSAAHNRPARKHSSSGGSMHSDRRRGRGVAADPPLEGRQVGEGGCE